MERKEAIEVIKKNWPDSSFTMLREALETLIPELKEHEDKNIKGAIIDHLKDNNLTEWAAWLEKQTTPQVRTGLEWVNTIDDACDKRYSEEYAHGEYCHEQSFKWGFQEGVDWLEKQGEPTDINPSEFDSRLNKLLKQFETLPKEELASSLSFYLNVVQNNGTYKAEGKQGEQPRYSIGDVLCDKSCTTLNKDAQPNFEITDIRNGMYICDKCSFPISQQDEYELVAKKIEQKSAWSEEDEDMLYKTTVILNKLCAKEEEFVWSIDTLKKLFYWLKSLKGRVQPKQEWSKEDIRNIDDIDSVLFYDKDLPEDTCVRLRNWLESLKPQNNITDEELAQAKKDAYNDALDKIEYHSGEPTFDDGWSAAIDYIRKKSLKPQNHWKPTEAQLASLTIACDRNDRIGFDLTQLLTELKKL